MKINFTILGNPKALKRHRTFRRGNFVGQYDPSKKEKDDFLVVAHQYAPEKPLDYPLRLDIRFYFERPKSHYRTGKYANELKPNISRWHTTSPDLDNLIKFICDSLNGVFWKDDRCICRLLADKEYDERPRTEITIAGENNVEKQKTDNLN